MTKRVTADNFNRAETDRHFAAAIRRAGDIGLFHHDREFIAVDKQTMIGANRDTLDSAAVFDLDAGPVTLTVPDSGRRYLSVIVIDRDHYTPAVFHRAG